MKINPATPVNLVAKYTMDGNPGAYEGAAAWTSDNAKDTFGNQTDDNAGGVARVTLNGSANVLGDTSKPSVSADVESGEGNTQLGGTLAEAIEWTPAVPKLANGVTLEIEMVPTA